MTKLTVLTSFLALVSASFGVGARVVERENRTGDVTKRTVLVQRDVVSPPITYPTTGTVWNVGDRHNVTWDTSVIPPGFKSNGMLVLGYLDNDANDLNEHLDLDHPLAQGFPITDGRAEITVPSVTTRNTYILVLFGDSGNASGKFTIKNIVIGGPGSSSIASSATSTVASSSASSSTSSTTSDDSSDSSSASAKATSSSGATAGNGSGSGTGPTSTASVPLASSTVTPRSSSLTTQGSPAAQSAPAATTSANAGTRTVLLHGSAAWISTVCSLAIVLGWAL